MQDIVHVIDDDPDVRDSLCLLLQASGYKARAHGACEEFLRALSPDETLCVVADLRMPEMGGLDLQAHLLEKSIDVPFIVVTGHGDVPSAVRALKSGAADFIEKPVDGKTLISAVERAASARRVAREKSLAEARAAERLSALTPRERDVLRHLVDGNPNKIIAHALGISPRTVENHRARLMDKLQASSVADLVRLALSAPGLAVDRMPLRRDAD
jgi:two-component system, LuxR family, response regulator FixJ